MLLYHGTKESNLAAIRENGICPRMEKAANHAVTNGNIESRPELTYLAAFMTYNYADMAAGEGRLVILEVETDRLDAEKLLPDEDTIAHEQIAAEGVTDRVEHLRRFPEVVSTVDPFRHKERWPELLERHGTVAYHGCIPPEAITRYAIIDPKTTPKLADLIRQSNFLSSAGKWGGSRTRAMATFVFSGDPRPIFDGLDESEARKWVDDLAREWQEHVIIRPLNESI